MISQDSLIGYLLPSVPVPNAVLILFFLAIVSSITLNRTALGRYTFVLGSNEEAVRLSGVNVDRWKIAIYGLGGAPGNQLAVVDVPSGKVTRTISLGPYTRPHGAMFLPKDETRVAVTSEATQNVVIVNIAEGKVEHAIPTGAAGSHMVAITADGTRAYTSDIGAGAVSELDLTARKLVKVIPVAPRVEGVAVTPDGRG